MIPKIFLVKKSTLGIFILELSILCHELPNLQSLL